MSNALLTPQVIANELLRRTINNLSFSRTINHAYDDRFANGGAKVGDTIKARVPVKFTATKSSTLNVQDVGETSVDVKIDTELNVGFKFSSKDQTLLVDDFSDRYLKSCSLALANQIDVDGLTLAYQSVPNAVGTPGVVPTAIKTYNQAMAKLDKAGCPIGSERFIALSSDMNVEAADALKAIFNDSKEVSRQNLKGYMFRWNGATWAVDQNIRSHTVGPLGGTPLVSGASQTGSSLLTKGWTSAAASRLKKGDIFSLDIVYGVNPVSGDTLGDLRQYLVTSDFSSDGSGNGPVSIYPPITTSGAGKTSSVSPADSAAITVLGAAGTVTPQGLAYHSDFITLAMAPYDKPMGVHMSAVATDPDTKVSLRIVGQFDITSGDFIYRVDCMYGWAMLLPTFACRIAS